MPTFGDRLAHAWNAFMNRDPTTPFINYGEEVSYSYNPSRRFLSRGNERSIVTSIYNRIAVDVSQINIKHIRVNQNGYYTETINSYLNDCLTVAANKDQTSRDFIQDVVMSMFDEGIVAIVPIDTNVNPNTSAFDIESMRTGQILEWRPDTIRVRIYNDRTGRYEEKWCLKRNTAIVENPFYSVMNAPNSTLQRLLRKLNLLDVIDEQSGSGKLDLIVKLPYMVKTPTKKQQAEERRKDIEMQLAGSKYGIAYVDATENITQLNRPVENNLMDQVKYLTDTLYGQLGITQGILDGTADEQTMMNYYSRTIEPIITAIVNAMQWKFLSKTARSQKQAIAFFRDPFKLVPTSKMAEIADKFTRNEIMSSNEIRQIVGLLPSNDPKADELRNKNLNQQENLGFPNVGEGMEVPIDQMPEQQPVIEQEPEEEIDFATMPLEELLNNYGPQNDMGTIEEGLE